MDWRKHKIESGLAALALTEQDLADKETYGGLTTRQALAFTEESRFALKEIVRGQLPPP